MIDSFAEELTGYRIAGQTVPADFPVSNQGRYIPAHKEIRQEEAADTTVEVLQCTECKYSRPQPDGSKPEITEPEVMEKEVTEPEVTEKEVTGEEVPEGEIPGEENPDAEEKQEEAPEAAETQQCPNYTLFQPGAELELYCACSKPATVSNGIPVGPEQVLAQYHARPPLLNPNPRHPVYAVPIPVNTNAGQPVSITPRQISGCLGYPGRIQCGTNPGRPAYTAPLPNNTSPDHVAPKH